MKSSETADTLATPGSALNIACTTVFIPSILFTSRSGRSARSARSARSPPD